MANSVALLEQIIKHTPMAIAVLDTNMRYLMVSNHWKQAYRLDEASIIGKSHYEVSPNVPERWKRIHVSCLAGQAQESTNDPFPRADGQVDYVSWRIEPWFDDAQHIAGMIMYTTVTTDTIERSHQIQAAEQRYKIVTNTLQEGLVIQNLKGEITECNTAAQKILGLSKNSLTGRSSADPRWQAIYEDGSGYQPDEHPAMMTLRTGMPVKDAIMGLKRPNNTIHWLNINSRPLIDGTKMIGVITTFKDISKEHTLKQTVQQLQQKLESVA